MKRAVLVVASVLAGCNSSPTEVVVVVRSDLPIRTMGAFCWTIAQEDGTPLAAPPCVDLTKQDDWPSKPVTLGIEPSGDPSQPFVVGALGFATSTSTKGAPLVLDRAQVNFSSDEETELDLFLDARCVAVTCAADYTCEPSTGVCVSDVRGSLPPFTLPESSDLAVLDLREPDGGEHGDLGPDLTLPVLQPPSSESGLTGPTTSVTFAITGNPVGGFQLVYNSAGTISSQALTKTGSPTGFVPTATGKASTPVGVAFQGSAPAFVFETTSGKFGYGGTAMGLTNVTYAPVFSLGLQGPDVLLATANFSTDIDLYDLMTGAAASVDTIQDSAQEVAVVAQPFDTLVAWRNVAGLLGLYYSSSSPISVQMSIPTSLTSDVSFAFVPSATTSTHSYLLSEHTNTLSMLDISLVSSAASPVLAKPVTLALSQATTPIGPIAAASGPNEVLFAYSTTGDVLYLGRYSLVLGEFETPIRAFNDNKSRTSPAIAYDPVNESFLVAYLEPGATASIIGFVYPAAH